LYNLPTEYFEAKIERIVDLSEFKGALIPENTPKKAIDILEAKTDFIDEIGLKEHLSPTRANGLVSMVKKIKMYALAYNSKG
jgi:hypothetical protein